jgi:hypothetical protein
MQSGFGRIEFVAQPSNLRFKPVFARPINAIAGTIFLSEHASIGRKRSEERRNYNRSQSGRRIPVSAKFHTQRLEHGKTLPRPEDAVPHGPVPCS